MALIAELSQPKQGSEPVHFASRHSLSAWGQYRTCFLKFLQTNWHNPNYVSPAASINDRLCDFLLQLS